MIHLIMEDFGYEQERLMLTWVSSAESDKFVAAVTKMTKLVKQLGPVASNQETVKETA